MATHSPFGSFMVSALIHSSAVVALIAAPELVPLNMGTEPPTQIEFEAVPAKGEPDAPLKKSKAEISLPAPAVAKTSVPTPAPPQPIVKEKPVKAEPEVATTLPEKEPTKEAPVEEVDDSNGVVAAAVEPEADEEIQEVAQEVATQEDTQLESQDKLLEQFADQEEQREEEASEENLAEEMESEVAALEEESMAEEVPSEEVVSAPSTAQRGVNQAVRSYESLSQVPGNAPPKYPSQARLNRQQGQVVLKYFVTTEGSVASLQLMQSSGFPLLDQEAVNSIRQFRYRPGQEGWTVHPVNFSLKGPEQKVGGRLRTSMR